MKKWMMLLLVASTLTGVLGGCTKLKETPVDELDYEMVDGEIVITGYKGTDREIVIPEEIQGRPVTQIGEDAFSHYDLVSLHLPDSIQKIKEGAFYDCDCLEKIRLSDDLRVIEDHAFDDCDALQELSLPESLEELGAFVFDSCELLDEVRLPDNVSLDILPPADGETIVVVNHDSKVLEQIVRYKQGTYCTYYQFFQYRIVD